MGKFLFMMIDLRIVTADDRDVPQGEVGEIIFRGHNVKKGYYKKNRSY